MYWFGTTGTFYTTVSLKQRGEWSEHKHRFRTVKTHSMLQLATRSTEVYVLLKPRIQWWNLFCHLDFTFISREIVTFKVKLLRLSLSLGDPNEIKPVIAYWNYCLIFKCSEYFTIPFESCSFLWSIYICTYINWSIT